MIIELNGTQIVTELNDKSFEATAVESSGTSIVD